MKKFVSIFLTTAIILGMLVAFPVFAEGSSSASYLKNSVIKATVLMPNADNITAIEGRLAYDSTKFAYVDGSFAAPNISDLAFSTDKAGTIPFNSSRLESYNLSSDHIVFQVRFTVLEDTTAESIISSIDDSYILGTDGITFIDVDKTSSVDIELFQSAPSESTDPSESSASEINTSEANASESQASETASSESSSSESNPTDPASSETQASESSASESAPSESSASETTAVEGFPVTFVTNGHVTINVYHTRDYATSIVDVDVTSAVSRERDAGYPDESGDGQVNFLVVFENGYELDTISADGGFKNLKGSEETLAVDMYRITKITGAVTVTINTKASASTSEASASETSASETQVSETSASETAASETAASESAASEASTSETSATTPTSAPKTTFKFAAAKTKIYVGATTLVKVTNLKNGKGATTYTSSNKKVATVTSSGKVKGLKAGSVIISAKNNGVVKKVKITIVKRTNPMTVKAKKLKVSAKAKKTTFKKAKAFTIKKAKGTVTFKKVNGDKKVAITKKGVITVKKGLKKGKTYKLKVKVTAKGTTAYKAKSKTVTVVIIIK